MPEKRRPVSFSANQRRAEPVSRRTSEAQLPVFALYVPLTAALRVSARQLSPEAGLHQRSAFGQDRLLRCLCRDRSDRRAWIATTPVTTRSPRRRKRCCRIRPGCAPPERRRPNSLSSPVEPAPAFSQFQATAPTAAAAISGWTPPRKTPCSQFRRLGPAARPRGKRRRKRRAARRHAARPRRPPRRRQPVAPPYRLPRQSSAPPVRARAGSPLAGAAALYARRRRPSPRSAYNSRSRSQPVSETV